MDEARDHGLATGISFPMHARGEVGVFSLIMDRDLARNRHQVLQAAARGHLLTAYVQETARGLMFQGAGEEAVRLTPRESECLLWAAAGKTAWETARLLAVSERTVVFHLGNAARKLGVANRRQAVARAIVQGLIQP